MTIHVCLSCGYGFFDGPTYEYHRDFCALEEGEHRSSATGDNPAETVDT